MYTDPPLNRKTRADLKGQAHTPIYRNAHLDVKLKSFPVLIWTSVQAFKTYTESIIQRTTTDLNAVAPLGNITSFPPGVPVQIQVPLQGHLRQPV